MSRSSLSLSSYALATALLLCATPVFAHGAHGGGSTTQQGGGQSNNAGQPMQMQPGGKMGKKTFSYQPRKGSKAVSIAVMGPPGNVHLEASWAPLAWLEVATRFSIARADFDAGSGRSMSALDRSAALFLRWIPMALHSPYVDVGMGVASERITGTDATSLGYGNSLAYSRDSVFASAYAGVGYTFRPGAGIVFSAGIGARSHLGAAGKSTFTEKGGVTDDEAAEVVSAMDRAAEKNDGLSFYGEASVGYAF